MPSHAGNTLLRAFIAVDLDTPVRAELAAVQERFRRLPCRVTWVRPAAVHITVLFLGDILAEGTDALVTALDGVARATSPFSFELAGVGTFGPPRSPRVVWAGVGVGRDPLLRLYEHTAAAARSLGYFWKEQPFHPHATLGRVRTPQHADALLAAVAEHHAVALGTIQATELLLMRSELTPDGPRYTPLHRTPFTSPGDR